MNVQERYPIPRSLLYPLRRIFVPVKICFLRTYLPKLARLSLMTSIIDFAVQRSRPL